MSTAARSIARWTAVALLVAISTLGLQSAVNVLGSAETLGQRVATAAQFGYALNGLLAAGALLGHRSWAPRPLWFWAALVTLTGGMAPVVWAGAGLGAGLAAGAATGATAGFVVWLATRRRTA
jgi:hypothetical protein